MNHCIGAHDVGSAVHRVATQSAAVVRRIILADRITIAVAVAVAVAIAVAITIAITITITVAITVAITVPWARVPIVVDVAP
jgi:hypothetical protein